MKSRSLDDQGIVHGIRNVSDLDEASGAYKSIDVVMDNQRDLVNIKTKLKTHSCSERLTWTYKKL